MFVIFPPQFKFNLTLWTAPHTELVLDPKMHSVLVPRHVPLLPEALVAQVTTEGPKLKVDVLLVPLETKICPEAPRADECQSKEVCC